jgi:hypothetical protein
MEIMPKFSFRQQQLRLQLIGRRGASVRGIGTGGKMRAAGTGRTHRDMGLVYCSVDFDVPLPLVPTQTGSSWSGATCWR